MIGLTISSVVLVDNVVNGILLEVQISEWVLVVECAGDAVDEGGLLLEECYLAVGEDSCGTLRCIDLKVQHSLHLHLELAPEPIVNHCEQPHLPQLTWLVLEVYQDPEAIHFAI